MRIAVIGGGVCGLTAAIELAKEKQDVVLFESAPVPGGRTRSFFDRKVNCWIDHGPHLMTGAYQATRQLLSEASHASSISDSALLCLQPSLDLALWDRERGLFHLKPNPSLPFGLGLLSACARLPGHHFNSASGMIRLLLASRRPIDPAQSVAKWLAKLKLPYPLENDLLTPLCLGIMNENPSTANAKSFCRVLRQVFANHNSARLAWFRKPISQALVDPIQAYACSLGVNIQTGTRVRQLLPTDNNVRLVLNKDQEPAFDSVILALPAWARNKLLGWKQHFSTRPISNIHLWFDDHLSLPEPLIGGLGTHGQWFFDISRLVDDEPQQRSHICAVISADDSNMRPGDYRNRICNEIGGILNLQRPPTPFHCRQIVERRATVLVRHQPRKPPLSDRIIDAGEEPEPGDLPATIEAAVLRGKQAATRLFNQKNR
ncbi:MAG: FAD-dependent oxidoreductase [Mariprofundaceae bacterium]